MSDEKIKEVYEKYIKHDELIMKIYDVGALEMWQAIKQHVECTSISDEKIKCDKCFGAGEDHYGVECEECKGDGCVEERTQ